MADNEEISLDIRVKLENKTNFVPAARVGSFDRDELFSTSGVFPMKIGKIKVGRSKAKPGMAQGNLKLVIPLECVKEGADFGKKTTKHQPVEGIQDRKDKSKVVYNIDGFYKFLESAGIATVDDIKAFPDDVTLGEMVSWLPEGTIVYVECQADLYEEKGTWSTKANDAVPKALYEQLVGKGEDIWPLPKEAIAWRESGGRAASAASQSAASSGGGANATSGGNASAPGGGNKVVEALRKKAEQARANANANAAPSA